MTTTLLVDDLEGAAHRMREAMPNTVYLVDKEGWVVQKALWTDHREVGAVLPDGRTVSSGDASQALAVGVDSLHPREV